MLNAIKFALSYSLDFRRAQSEHLFSIKGSLVFLQKADIYLGSISPYVPTWLCNNKFNTVPNSVVQSFNRHRGWEQFIYYKKYIILLTSLIKGPVLPIMLYAPLLLFWFSWERGVYWFLVLFELQTMEASEFSTSQKWPPSSHSAQYLMGNTGSLVSSWLQSNQVKYAPYNLLMNKLSSFYYVLH